VTGSHLQTTTVARIKGKVIDTPTVDQTTPVFDLAQDKIVWMSILSSNVVYAAGTNDIANVPADSAAFYRALDGTNSIMPIVLDQQILAWFGADGLTLPYGTLNLMESNLTANVQMYDGSGGSLALRFLSDPDTGWHRPSDNVWRYVAGGNLVADFGTGGITMQSGKTVNLNDGSRAVSLAEIEARQYASISNGTLQVGGSSLNDSDTLIRGDVTIDVDEGDGEHKRFRVAGVADFNMGMDYSGLYMPHLGFWITETDRPVFRIYDQTQTNWVDAISIDPAYGRVEIKSLRDIRLLPGVDKHTYIYSAILHRQGGAPFPLHVDDNGSSGVSVYVDGATTGVVVRASGTGPGYAALNVGRGGLYVDEGEPAMIGASPILTAADMPEFAVSGTNLLVVIGGVTNRVVLEAYP